MDFAFELPVGVQIESTTQARDCVTWEVYASGDD